MTDCEDIPIEPKGPPDSIGPSKPAGKCAEAAGGKSAARQRPEEIEGTVQRIARALGISEAEAPGDLPDLAGAVKDLERRLGALEATVAGGAPPAERAEPLGAGGQGGSEDTAATRERALLEEGVDDDAAGAPAEGA